MAFRPRHLLIRWLLPITWRWNAGQKARLLQEFAQTELDSAWQSVYALERVTDLRLRSLLFNHAFEELFHSDLFNRLAGRKAAAVPVIPLTRREPLLDVLPGDSRSAAEFFAYLAIGEGEIQSDFEAYEASIPDEEVRSLFGVIRQDEVHHAADSAEALKEIASDAGLSITWVRIRHLGQLAYRRYVSLMNKFGVIPMTAMLSVAYFVLGAVFVGQARQRLLLGRDSQLSLLLAQQADFDASLVKRR